MNIRKISVLILGIALILGNSCTEKENSLSLKQKDQINKIGSEAASSLLKNLKGHLRETLASGNTAEAFEFCAASDLDLTKEAAENLPEGLEIKRTTMRPRNPENAPDKYENDALAYFEAQIIKTDTPPESYIQYVKEKSEYRYYQPIAINEICLRCHGDPDDFEEDIRQSLSEYYPQDPAVGYKIGDFRGIIRVSIPIEIIKPR